jgi:hypothetical protein
LGPDWRAASLKAGPLWFVDGRQSGYVHYSGPHGAGRAIQRRGPFHLIVMVVEVASGSTVVMKPAAEARPYFRFVNGFHPGGGNPLPAGDSGFTFVACPRGQAGPNGLPRLVERSRWATGPARDCGRHLASGRAERSKYK